MINCIFADLDSFLRAQTPETSIISTIPPNGHPENKYVISREFAATEAAAARSYIRTRTVDGQEEYVVQYDRDGTLGQPIAQPNKHTYLPTLGYRLGRDRALLLEDGGRDQNLEDLRQIRLDATAQVQEFQTPNPVTLQTLAIDLHKIAPDLAEEAGITGITENPTSISERDAGRLLQNQVLEELNNNWESRFPENETVWNFAEDRANATVTLRSGREVPAKPHQFFSMRKWPPACQTAATQTRIAALLPQIQEKVQPRPVVQMTRAEMMAEMNKPRNRERHTGRGQYPHFPFGETGPTADFMDKDIQYHLMDSKHILLSCVKLLANKFRRRILPEAQTPTLVLSIRSPSTSRHRRPYDKRLRPARPPRRLGTRQRQPTREELRRRPTFATSRRLPRCRRSIFQSSGGGVYASL